jgi:hypothetical protein
MLRIMERKGTTKKIDVFETSTRGKCGKTYEVNCAWAKIITLRLKHGEKIDPVGRNRSE